MLKNSSLHTSPDDSLPCDLGLPSRLEKPSSRQKFDDSGSGEPPLPGKNRRPFVSCSGRRVACIATLVLAAGAAASTGEILPDLELLALNLHRRWRCDNRLFTGRIRDWINHPHPAGMAVLIDSPGCATAFPDFHSPVGAVGRNREHIRDCGRDHHSAQHSSEK
jgi:hypothetical protein